jgi:hypothetical protein
MSFIVFQKSKQKSKTTVFKSLLIAIDSSSFKSGSTNLKVLQKTLVFICDFLEEGIRYVTFPIDFQKLQTIFFHKKISFAIILAG